MERGPGTWLLWIAAAALLALTATRLLGSEPEPVRVGGGAAGAPAGADGALGAASGGSGAAGGASGGARRPSVPAVGSPGAAGAGGLYVHVAGRVRRPGLYRLAAGERVAAAIERAGGPARRADLAKVNLAARVEDGQQVVVPRVGATAGGEVAGGASAGGGGASAPGAKLSLASATVDQLDRLDGIGPTLARRIVEFRERRGGLRSIGQLREVEGIGEKRFAALREALGP